MPANNITHVTSTFYAVGRAVWTKNAVTKRVTRILRAPASVVTLATLPAAPVGPALPPATVRRAADPIVTLLPLRAGAPFFAAAVRTALPTLALPVAALAVHTAAVLAADSALPPAVVPAALPIVALWDAAHAVVAASVLAIQRAPRVRDPVGDVMAARAATFVRRARVAVVTERRHRLAAAGDAHVVRTRIPVVLTGERGVPAPGERVAVVARPRDFEARVRPPSAATPPPRTDRGPRPRRRRRAAGTSGRPAAKPAGLTRVAVRRYHHNPHRR
jgi:hypothetical protein